MLTTAYYFLQVIICSAILIGYYWLVLRNKRFHQYNRFYLLGVGLLSWLVPLIKIQLAKPEEQTPTQLLQFANIVASGNTEIEQIVVQDGFVVNWNLLVMCIYTTVSIVFLSMIAVGLYRVFKLLKTYSCKSLGDVYLIMTKNVKGTPFSFFQYIFWNDAIDANTSTGQQMMQHELTHVREKHSIDKLFIQLVMVFGWFNPFFWLLKRELHLVHEFIADNKAIKDGDVSSLAAMLLAAAYPNHQYALGNSFFFSPIKRRILMLTKTNNPRLSYARRVVVLPLLAVTVMLFAFRKKELTKAGVPLNKTYTVVIDAGHGGTDHGASATDGTREKDLALLLLKAIKNANTNNKIKLVFTREEDVYQTPIEKATFVNEQKADLFISLHVNWATKKDAKTSGIELVIPKDDGKRGNIWESKAFANDLQARLVTSFSSTGIHTKGKGVWVLGATTCPAVLLECGYLSNANDLALLKDETKRTAMAELILEGIGDYLKKMETAKLPTEEQWERASENATIKGSAQVIVKKLKPAIEVNLSDSKVAEEPQHARAGRMVKVTASSSDVTIFADSFSYEPAPKARLDLMKALVILDGQIVAWDEIKKLSPANDFSTVTFLKNAASIAPYGDAGKNGVVLITTKTGVPVTMSASPSNKPASVISNQ